MQSSFREPCSRIPGPKPIRKDLAPSPLARVARGYPRAAPFHTRSPPIATHRAPIILLTETSLAKPAPIPLRICVVFFPWWRRGRKRSLPGRTGSRRSGRERRQLWRSYWLRLCGCAWELRGTGCRRLCWLWRRLRGHHRSRRERLQLWRTQWLRLSRCA